MKNENQEGLKSLYLELENFKNISKKVVKIDGHSLLFIGKNGSGKSTLIQAMMSPMDTKVRPSEPVKKGEERAKITHRIGGVIHGQYKEYTMEIFFTNKDKKGRLVITNEAGEVLKSPSTQIKSIIGNVSFDPTQWLHLDKAKKIEVLKRLTGKNQEIDAITVSIENKKAEIKANKLRYEAIEGSLSTHEFTKDEIDMYSTPIPIEPIQQEMAQISHNQKQWDDIANKTFGFKQSVASCEKIINDGNEELERLRVEYEANVRRVSEKIEAAKKDMEKDKENVEKGENWLKSVNRPSVDEVNKRLNDAIAHNTKHERILHLSSQNKEVVKLKDVEFSLKDEVSKLEKQRDDIIKNSQLPVEGLSFSDDEIFIDGLPLEEGQINTSRIFDISVDIAMAMNPTLKVIFLHDGSLFDKDGLARVIRKIEENGYMAVVELVDYDGGDLDIKFTEEEFKGE